MLRPYRTNLGSMRGSNWTCNLRRRPQQPPRQAGAEQRQSVDWKVVARIGVEQHRRLGLHFIVARP